MATYFNLKVCIDILFQVDQGVVMFDALFCYLLRCPLACLKTRQANR